MVKIARATNLIMGVWLAASAFLWIHSTAQERNAWMVGLIAAVTASLAMGIPRLRWVNGVLALWLFVSAWVLPHASSKTIWNSVLVAAIMFGVSVAETRGPVGSRSLS